MKRKSVLRKTLAISVLTLLLLLQSAAVFASGPAPPPPPPEPDPAYLLPAETADQVYVSFQSLYNDRYVHVENGCGDNIKADRYVADSNLDEIFIMNGSSGLQDGTTVNIRTACGDCYFVAWPDGDLDAKTESAGNNETFELINVTNPGGYLHDGDTIGLRSNHGKYVRVKKDTLGLDARNTVLDQPWEKFKVVFQPEPEKSCETGLEGIHRVGLSVSNTYIVEGEKDGKPVLMVVDTGIITDIFGIQQAISDLGYDNSDVKLIYITHAHIDHYGSAASLRCATGAKIMVHKDDADNMRWGLSPLGDMKITPLNQGFVESILGFLASGVLLPPTPPDIVVEDGDSLEDYGFNARVIHLPGHTYGSSGLILTRGDRTIAFVGDLLSNRTGTPQVQNSYAMDWDQIRPSVEKLKALNPDFVCPGHGEIFSGDVLHGFYPNN